MVLILSVLAVFAIIAGTELWWRRHSTHGEFSRKFIHITVGSFVAFWPYFLSWRQIQLMSVAFLIVVGVSKYLHIFKAIHSVQRPTWGELYFALAVGLVPFLTTNKYIFTAALLQMSLADGLAAMIGGRFGKQTYLVFGHKKSILGTATFYIVSSLLFIGYATYTGVALSPILIVVGAGIATLTENLAVQGLDNLLVPLIVAELLVRF